MRTPLRYSSAGLALFALLAGLNANCEAQDSPQELGAASQDITSAWDVVGESRPSSLAQRSAAFGQLLQPGDERLLDDIQRGCHNYFWKEVGVAEVVKDRKLAPVSSVAAIGFQLSSLPIAVERGWVTHEVARRRAQKILSQLTSRSDNKRFGLYLHFVDLDTAGLSESGYEVLVSTVDSALLFAGAIVAGEYFGGECQTLASIMVDSADWAAFAKGPNNEISMGWRPMDRKDLSAKGEFHPSLWHIASDEERLIYFLACGANEGKRIPPETYFRLQRIVKRHEDLPHYVVAPGGSVFQYVFSHCWIDYRSLGGDDPSRLGVTGPRVDWAENSRRAIATHRRRCIDQGWQFKSLSSNTWGLSPCVSSSGYLVPHVQPNLSNRDHWGQGTLAPYAAASAIMFTPKESLEALRTYRNLRIAGKPIFVSPKEGGYGLVDAYNVDQQWVCDDWVGIDVGPTMVAIENARSGLVWRLFMESRYARRAIAALRLR